MDDDDEIEVIEEFPASGRGGASSRFFGSGARDQFGRSINRRFKTHFIFSNAIGEKERVELHGLIRRLGGKTIQCSL